MPRILGFRSSLRTSTLQCSYLTSSPEDDAYQLTVAATRTITYRSSAGNGTRNSLDRTLTVDYDVDEIQTIGISN